ncbi:hypothetical protein C4572_03950 [Candidatus Parcubacteria bacterium]|nr:MAG: hypothetical protein C4572_03950 [Candidatus Parcubacteria bacterium]
MGKEFSIFSRQRAASKRLRKWFKRERKEKLSFLSGLKKEMREGSRISSKVFSEVFTHKNFQSFLSSLFKKQNSGFKLRFVPCIYRHPMSIIPTLNFAYPRGG